MRRIEKEKGNKGFTLIELVIVVAILAILVGLLAPQYTKYVEKSRKAADVSDIKSYESAMKMAFMEGRYETPTDGNTYVMYEVEIADAQTIILRSEGSSVEDFGYPNQVSGTEPLYDALSEILGENFAQGGIRGHNWGQFGNPPNESNSIYVDCILCPDGSVYTEYSEELTNYLEQTNG